MEMMTFSKVVMSEVKRMFVIILDANADLNDLSSMQGINDNDDRYGFSCGHF